MMYQVTFKRIIRHAHSYRGGGDYGVYGGYDISILELDQPIDTGKFACLPSHQYDDITGDGILAGYGKYFRSKCQTNEHGLAKYHYCETHTCKHDQPPQRPECRGLLDKHPFEDGIEEAMIVEGDSDPIFCFKDVNPESKDYGWCDVEGDYFDLDEVKSKSMWGYCSKDCYLDLEQESAGVLRIVDKVSVWLMNSVIKKLSRF